MRRAALALEVLLLFAFVMVTAAPPAAAHAPYVAISPTGPSPTEDGACADPVYGTRGFPLLFLQGPSLPAVHVRILSDTTHLYVCLADLPLGAASQTPAISLAFDPDNRGGSAPGTDDLEFAVTMLGARSAFQGDGTAFVPATISGWTARTHSGGGSTWSAEFKIPLTPIHGGGLDPVGFQMHHTNYQTAGDDHPWPPAGQLADPDSAGELVWFLPPGSPLHGVQVDVARVTQGLDVDASAPAPYDLVAGKDTLVRTQLYAADGPRRVDAASCSIQAEGAGAVQVPVTGLPSGPVPAAPAGYFNGNPVFDCWVPGADVVVPGTYHLSLQVQLHGDPTTHTVALPDRVFQPSGDLRLLLAPAAAAPGDPDPRARQWDEQLLSLIPLMAANVQRIMALPAGVGNFRFSSIQSADLGLRYTVLPMVELCRADEPSPSAACGARVTTDVGDAMTRMNAAQQQHDVRTGSSTDRVDYAATLWAANSALNAGDCAFGQDRIATMGGATSIVAGDWVNQTDGWTEEWPAHELSHCLGQVNSHSPNSDPNNVPHSRHDDIPLETGTPGVNLLSRDDIAAPFSIMHPTIGADDTRYLLEGTEWNSERNALATAPRPGATAGPESVTAGSPLFRISGYVDDTGTFVPGYSERVTDLPLALSPAQQGSKYFLEFHDKDGNLLSSLPFTPSVPATHGTWTFDRSVLLTTLLPASAVKADIRTGNQILEEVPFTAADPVVKQVVATPGAGSVGLSWDAADADSPNLTYNVYLRTSQNADPMLVAAGLTATSFTFDPTFAPAAPNAVLLVDATDGLNSTTVASNPFAIDLRPPVAAIQPPPKSEQIVAGQRVSLNGGAFDTTAGALVGRELVWSVGGNTIGKGARITLRPSPGKQDVTLTATAPSGLKATAVLALDALADSDGDGMPDPFESSHACLSPSKPDGALDPDGDGLTSLAEFERGTDPCSPDSDGDGVGDGDEARLGSNPLSAKSLPAPNVLFFNERTVDLGSCPTPSTAAVPVSTASSSTVWRVGADVSWLQVDGGTGKQAVTIGASCAGLAKGVNIGHVLFTARGGQFRVLQVRLNN